MHPLPGFKLDINKGACAGCDEEGTDRDGGLMNTELYPYAVALPGTVPVRTIYSLSVQYQVLHEVQYRYHTR